jgi:hypothetical protein
MAAHRGRIRLEFFLCDTTQPCEFKETQVVEITMKSHPNLAHFAYINAVIYKCMESADWGDEMRRYVFQALRETPLPEIHVFTDRISKDIVAVNIADPNGSCELCLRKKGSRQEGGNTIPFDVTFHINW